MMAIEVRTNSAVPDVLLVGDDERSLSEAERPLANKGRPPPGPERRGRSPPLHELSTSPQDREDVSQRPNATSNGQKRKRCRRKNKGGRHHRKWRPYNKLSWDERKVLDERESRRANLRREERFASGQPMAPYNTTQFLMEQHEPSAEDLNLDGVSHRALRPPGSREGSGSGAESSSDDYYYGDSPNDDEIFMEAAEKDFTEAYENFHAERLQSLTKEELVREYLELESKVEAMQKVMRDSRPSAKRGDLPAATDDATSPPRMEGGLFGSQAPSGDLAQTASLQLEIQRLREENHRLQAENEHLKSPSDTPKCEL